MLHWLWLELGSLKTLILEKFASNVSLLDIVDRYWITCWHCKLCLCNIIKKAFIFILREMLLNKKQHIPSQIVRLLRWYLFTDCCSSNNVSCPGLSPQIVHQRRPRHILPSFIIFHWQIITFCLLSKNNNVTWKLKKMFVFLEQYHWFIIHKTIPFHLCKNKDGKLQLAGTHQLDERELVQAGCGLWLRKARLVEVFCHSISISGSGPEKTASSLQQKLPRDSLFSIYQTFYI